MREMDEISCENCGYNLAAGGRIGQCPECGTTFNKSTGEGIESRGLIAKRQAKFDFMLARIRTLVLAGLAAALLGTGIFMFMYAHNATVLWLGLVLGGFFGLAALTSFLYEKPET